MCDIRQRRQPAASAHSRMRPAMTVQQPAWHQGIREPSNAPVNLNPSLVHPQKPTSTAPPPLATGHPSQPLPPQPAPPTSPPPNGTFDCTAAHHHPICTPSGCYSPPHMQRFTVHSNRRHMAGDGAASTSAAGGAGAAAAAEEPEGPAFLAFAGTARRLDGKPITTPSAPVPVHLPTSNSASALLAAASGASGAAAGTSGAAGACGCQQVMHAWCWRLDVCSCLFGMNLLTATLLLTARDPSVALTCYCC